MDVVHPRCAGIDISKRDAKVCVRAKGPVARERKQPSRPGGRSRTGSSRCATTLSQRR